MNKSLKKVLVASASLLMFASVGAVFSNVNHTANAAFRPEDQYLSKFNCLVGGKNSAGIVSHNFHKHGYLFNVYTTGEQYKHDAEVIQIL